MKKIIPFKKQINFKTNINEIISISLENTLHKIDKNIEGDLIISGTYKITETSTKVDEFEYKIPINIEVNDKYDSEKLTIDIEDFYYEVVNNNILEVNIEILLDNIMEKNEIKESEENKMEQTEIQNERCIEEEQIEEIKESKEPIEEKKETKEQMTQDIISNLNKEEYSTYYIYIVREGDTIDTIMAKYNINKEKLEEYNNINELKLGDKIIIPENKNAGN